MRKDVELYSVRDRDLRVILARFHLDAAVDDGTALCDVCSRSITWDNLGAIRVRSATLILVCDLPECLQTASSTEV
jgi:hypothetical protein